MAIRKRIYKYGETVFICGQHVLRGRSGVVITTGSIFGSYRVEINGRWWEIRGKNLRDSPMKK